MLDFFQISVKEARKEGQPSEVRPDFKVGRSKDLMVRGGAFYAIWDETIGLWSTDEYDVQRLVDSEIRAYVEKLESQGMPCTAKYLSSFGTNGWSQFRKFMKNISDNSHQLDMKLTFANTEVKKSDHVSRRLPYNLSPGSIEAWDELVSFLYDPEERAKIEWAIGAIISGDARRIEKFLVLYGPGGTGKSTILKIIEKLFEGYVAMFEAKALVGNNNAFSTEAFKHNPLVAIQHDGDLSKIEDNSKLNSIVGHDKMLINEKYKPGYEMKMQAMLFMGTNKPVKITDAKSGLIRRLIDVKPTGNKFELEHYQSLMAKIDFELGAIANHCLTTFKSMGPGFYNRYQPTEMMLETDVFFNFIEAHFDIFKEQDGATLKQAHSLWKVYAEDSQLEYKIPLHKFRTKFGDYFDEFYTRTTVDGVLVSSYFKGFNANLYKVPVKPETTPKTFILTLGMTVSLLDEMYSGMPAQYSKKTNETPARYWTDDERVIDGELKKPDSSSVCDTVLGDLDTSKLHFLKVPSHHIVIDFDLTENGKKSLESNLKAASLWPATYAEVSKSGNGLHLHYIYDGDVNELARVYSPGIEIKVFTGNASLRRRLTECNSVPVATISSGLPFREKTTVLEEKTLQDEKHLRNLIVKCLNKDMKGISSTKVGVDFIKKLLDDAYAQGMIYDVTDMRRDIMIFANGSTNQALHCLKTMKQMKFKSEISSEDSRPPIPATFLSSPIVLYDVEVFPNLFIICWMYENSDTVVRMINPSALEVEQLFQYKLVGFNNRKYDNHIIYAASLGWGIPQLYELSHRIVVLNDKNALFREAYNLSYADIYEFASIKMGLKKWQIKLGLPHVEMDLSFDKPVPKELWEKVTDYCCNDVHSTKAVWLDRKQDYVARQLLASMSGLPVNATTQKHTSKIIFGDDRKASEQFVYTDLSEEFPGYVYDFGVSTYCGETVGEGGYVYAEPGFYQDVAVLDVASMHPTSLIQLNYFGKYTGNFKDLVEARLAIKHAAERLKKHNDPVGAEKFLDQARGMLGGKFLPFLPVGVSLADMEALAYALKIVINIVYGLTSAKWENDFNDIRNKDNIVAKRGALFMVDLKKFVQANGFQAVHIKTDSIKIPNASPIMIEKVMEFGKKYGYEFEHETTYDKFCLVNDAVYIAREKDNKPTGEKQWSAVGAQFQHPYVFKTLFSGEAVKFDDLCETKEVRSPWAMYLDHNPDKATPSNPNADLIHVGKTGRFVPVIDGASLVKLKEEGGTPYAVTGTKGYKWLEADMVKKQSSLDLPFFDMETVEGVIEMRYFDELIKAAKENIGKYIKYEELVAA